MLKHFFVIFVCTFFLQACTPDPSLAERTDGTLLDAEHFVEVRDGQFYVGSKHFTFVGANMWYGAYLGSPESDIGDRQRLLKELDLLSAKGITNLRILGASEVSPHQNAIRPAINNQGTMEREDIFIGLDFLLSEMQKRNMRAVIYLNNFWEWSGGMATYLYWVNGGEIVDMADKTKPWPAYPIFTADFYQNEAANALYYRYIEMLLARTNSITGVAYIDDPTIMSWQLANEPRPGHKSESAPDLEAYYAWIEATASLIKSLAPKQLVSLGGEGVMGCVESAECVFGAHKNTNIDYFTFHLWLKNWGWFDINRPNETFDDALGKAKDYIDTHKTFAEQLGMPAVLEEFGLERDFGEFSPGTSTVYRNRYLTFVYEQVELSIKSGESLVGTNIWAWGGFGEAHHPDALWRNGDSSFTGDPPQEPQGLNSVFASDTDTLEIMNSHATALNGGCSSEC